MNIYGWTGYDYDENSYVEIEKGELVREGKEIEILALNFVWSLAGEL